MLPSQSKTILVDLRGCQINQDRGIPAYAQSLVLQLCQDYSQHQYLFFYESNRPYPFLAKDLSTFGLWHEERQLAKDPKLHIDVLFTTCFFVDLKHRGGEYLYPNWLKRHSPITMGIVYDLIPFLFPEHYFSIGYTEESYLSALRTLKTYDRLYAISEATRQDTIRHVGVDPFRVKRIDGDIDIRKRALLGIPSPAGIPEGFGLDREYFLYIGGEDWRKNMEGMVRGFAALHATHPEIQMALICKMSEERKAYYQQMASSLSVRPGALICTGLVTDEELVALTRQAKAMVFPSIYEGLGLPILEAYGCGLPVLGSDTSSIRELVHKECRFNPSHPEQIAASMQRFLEDPALQNKSKAFGQAMLSRPGWRTSAATVAQAFEDPPVAVRQPIVGERPRIAVIGALPPAKTGIAAYTYRYLQSDSWDTDFFTPDADLPIHANYQGLKTGNRILPSEVLPIALRRNAYHRLLFVLGNSRHHEGVLRALFHTRLDPGPQRWLYLHEADLLGLLKVYLGNEHVFLLEHATSFSPNIESAAPWLQGSLRSFPGLGPGLRFLHRTSRLNGIMVNSNACRDLIRAALAPDSDTLPIEVTFLPIESPSIQLPTFNHQDSMLRLGHFGIPARNKCPLLLIEAARILASKRKILLTFAGWGTQKFAEKNHLTRLPFLSFIDAPGDEELIQAMAQVDLGIQLRVPTTGETSGVVSQLLSLGRRVVVTNEGSYSELPEGWAIKVPSWIDAPNLAKIIEETMLRSHPLDHATMLSQYSPSAFTARISKILEIS